MITDHNESGRGQHEEAPRYSIGEVSRRTGLSIHVLRAWERRYGVVTPGRTPGRQRLYTDVHVKHLRLLRQATESGHSIGQVAGLGTSELVTLLGGARQAASAPAANGSAHAAETVEACLAAGGRLDDSALDGYLRRAIVRMNPQTFASEVVGPLLQQAGERWHDGSWQPAQEHVVSVTVRRVLQWLLETYAADGSASLMVCTTVAGERHELGAMLAAVVAADEGWRVLFLGPDLPAADIGRTARVRGADAVALSLIHDQDEARAVQELRALRAELPEGTVLLVGGRGVSDAVAATVRAVGGSAVPDLDTLRRALRAVSPAGGRTEPE